MVIGNKKTFLLGIIKRLPEGYSEVFYDKIKYGITKLVFNNEKSFKIYAKELKGTDFISLNYYITKSDQLLKPCEMPEQKVIDFLKNLELLNYKNGKL